MQDGFLKHADNYDIRRFCLVIGCEWLRRQKKRLDTEPRIQLDQLYCYSLLTSKDRGLRLVSASVDPLLCYFRLATLFNNLLGRGGCT